MYNLEDEKDDELWETIEEDGNDIRKKDWFGPAVASMARLNQIQTNVYNMGFHNPNTMKATSRIRKTQQQSGVSLNKPDLQIADYAESQDEEIEERRQLSSRKAQPSPTQRESAWGSNHSIPELLARQMKPRVSRPSSAKIVSECRLKTVSAVKGRPQSAKEPLCKNDELKSKRALGVMGNKKSVLPTKPPPRAAAPVRKHPLTERAWAGTPPGFEQQPHQAAQDGLMEVNQTIPTAPCSSPIPSDEDFDDDDENDDVKHIKTPPLLRRPLPTPIHLSLPSTDDIADLNRDEETTEQEPDTERLLKDADNYMKKKQEQGHKMENGNILQSRNATLPENSVSPTSSSSHSNPSQSYNSISSNLKENVKTSSNHGNSQRSKGTDNIHCTSNESKPGGQMLARKNIEGEHSKRNPSSNSMSPFDSGERTDLSGGFNPMPKPGVQIREDRNITVDITPRNAGRKVVDKKPSFLQEKNTSLRNKFNHSNCPCDIRLEDLSLTDKEKKDLVEFQKNNKEMKKSAKEGMVSMVTVEYEDDEQPTANKKQPIRRRKPMSEVETLVSQLSGAEGSGTSEIDGATSISDLLHRSKPERNYYEVARYSTQGTTKPCQHSEQFNVTSHGDESAVYMTTKTVEFDANNFQETSVKSVIGSQAINKAKREPISFNLKQLKHGVKSTKDESSKKDPRNSNFLNVQDQQDMSEMDVLEEMLQEAKAMAQNSINDASRSRPPSGRVSTLKTKSRPPSAKQEKDKTESKPKPKAPLIRASSLSDIDKARTKPQGHDSHCEHKKCFRHTASHTARLPPASTKSISRPATASGKPVIISSSRQKSNFETPSSLQCREITSRMSDFGINVDSDVLERALFPPSGNNLHYDVPGDLPKNPSDGLLSHYKYWLPEDYKRIKLMEKRLAQDDHIRHLQELAAKKKAKKEAGKLKGKKKKKEKLERRNSIC